MPLQSEFDRFAGDYRGIHDQNLTATGYSSPYFAERKVREIHAWIKPYNSSPRILDVGCGDGLCTHFFSNYFPNSDIQGLDISLGIISKAQGRNRSKTGFALYDGTRIPFLSEVFDIILLANVLHHISTVEKRAAILRECHRALKKNGTLFIFEHNPINPVTRRLVNRCLFDRNAWLILHTRMKRLLQWMNFDVKCRFIIFFPGFMVGLDFLEKLFWWAPVGGQYYTVCTKAPR